MRAVIWTAYGPTSVLQLREVPKPTPREDELLIKVQASTVTAGDCELRRFDLPGWIWLPVRLYMGVLKPRVKILGQEFSGEVEAIGNQVTKFQPGDRIFAAAGMKLGGYADYVCLSEKEAIATSPAGMDLSEAATIPTGGINGLHFLRKGKVQEGEELLINGAGGSIGTYAIQIARHMGARVTAVDTARKSEMMLSIGAERAIDYQKMDFTKEGKKYDVIIDIAGQVSYAAYVNTLKEGGRLVLGNPRLGGMLRAPWTSRFSSKQVIVALAKETKEDFQYLKTLIEAGKIRSVVDKVYPLEQIHEAHEYVERGLKKGNVIIKVAGDAGQGVK